MYEIPENAKIIKIHETNIRDEDGFSYEGLEIVTDKGDIKLVITDGQNCCENYGNLFFDTPDDIEQFIGAEIIRIEDIDVIREYDIDNETQLRIITNKGIIQYAIYNEHNGYYSHGTILQVFDKIEYGSL